METKKQPRKDLYRLSHLFISLGFLISLSIVLTAFEWRFSGDPLVDLRKARTSFNSETVIIPPTDLTPPKPAPRPVEFVEVKKEESETMHIPHIDLGEEPSEDIPSPAAAVPEESVDSPFFIVEESAHPAGGWDSFYAFITKQLRGKYPVVAKRIGIEGRVFVEFVVEQNGQLTDVHVIKGIGGGCDELAVKAVTSAPAWLPGKQRGKAVRQRCTIPIFFKLN